MLTPAAVILDVMMDNEEAWNVLLRIRREERLNKVPVVIVSSLSEREKAAALGADVYLQKPVDRKLLLDTLESLVTRAAPIRVLAIDAMTRGFAL